MERRKTVHDCTPDYRHLTDEPARLVNDAVSTLLQREMEHGFERGQPIALIHRK
jgi:hypothetical protein